MGNRLVGIVDHNSQLVGVEAILAVNKEIIGGFTEGYILWALQLIGEAYAKIAVNPNANSARPGYFILAQ